MENIDYGELFGKDYKKMEQLLYIFGVNDLDYTEESLMQMESLINERFPVGHVPLASTLIPFGCYLTKCLHKGIDGSELKLDVKSIWDVEVKFKPNWSSGKMSVFPFRRMQKFWKDRSDGLSTILKSSVFIMENDITKMDHLKDDEGWITIPGGFKIRAQVAQFNEDGEVSNSKVELNVNKIIPNIE